MWVDKQCSPVDPFAEFSLVVAKVVQEMLLKSI